MLIFCFVVSEYSLCAQNEVLAIDEYMVYASGERYATWVTFFTNVDSSEIEFIEFRMNPRSKYELQKLDLSILLSYPINENYRSWLSINKNSEEHYIIWAMVDSIRSNVHVVIEFVSELDSLKCSRVIHYKT